MRGSRKRIGFIGSVPDPLHLGAVAPELHALAGPDVELVPYPSRVAAFPYTPLERSLQELGYADAAFAAAEDGCDAVVIDSVGDYGLETMRAVLPIPAIGSGAAGMAAATTGGRRFAIVTVWPRSMNFIVESRLRQYGHAATCTGIFNVGAEEDLQGFSATSGYLSEIRRGQKGIRDKIAESMAAAAAGDADAILLGCTCMSRMASSLAASTPVPMVNPLAAALAAALTSHRGSQRDVRPRSRELLREMVDSIAEKAPEACPVCIVGKDPR